ncbi:MAG: MoaD/ThiS family protein [Verrucomicrobiae bacterium]|nr:MoaD/ThiS family protein [Verrucomicrobiae bacterium]
MPVCVRIPTPLRKLTRNQDTVNMTGATVGEVLAALERRFPGVEQRLRDEQGRVRPYVNIFANDEDIRFLRGLETPVKDGDEITIVPALAGG